MINCKIRHCKEPLYVKEMCKFHYLRLKRGYPVEGPRKKRINFIPKLCKTNNCQRGTFGQGLCYLHHNRLVRGFDVHAPEKNRGFSITKKGYKKITINGKQVFEHRYIMEQSIGRKLKRSELVHHKNHNKLDNRIENLEIMDFGSHTTLHLKKFTHCTVPGCINKFLALGFCKKHYSSYKRNLLQKC